MPNKPVPKILTKRINDFRNSIKKKNGISEKKIEIPEKKI